MITHKQAFYIRACEELSQWRASGDKAVWDELDRLNLIQEDPDGPDGNTFRIPTDLGRAALAEYDREFAVVRCGLIRDAFVEGYSQGSEDAHPLSHKFKPGGRWENSEAKEELENR